ncbi:MAG: CtsR family transcriptional regulator [Bacillota bacterium]
MPALCNSIEQFIKSLMTEDDNELELQRNELAQHFKCAPSHINYVLSTRFTLERGYAVQSRRGGGGFIRIVRIDIDENDYLYSLLTERIGETMDEKEANEIIGALLSCKVITSREAALMKAGVSDKAIIAPVSVRDAVRAMCLKSQVSALLKLRKEGKA